MSLFVVGELLNVFLVTFGLLFVGFLWYGPLFSGTWVRTAFGSLSAWRQRVAHSSPSSYRLCVANAALGSLVLVATLHAALKLSAAASLSDALRLGLVATCLAAGARFNHDIWSGSRTGALILDSAFDVLAIPAAVAALFVGSALFA